MFRNKTEMNSVYSLLNKYFFAEVQY